jgi:hypothetical protein
LVLENGDSLVPLLASVGIDPIESNLLSRQEEGTNALGHILDNLCRGCRPMGEVSGSTKATCPNSIPTCSAAKGATGQIGTKGGSKGRAAAQPADVGRNARSSMGGAFNPKCRSNCRGKSTGSTSREVATAGLTDGSGTTDWLAIDAGIGWLISQ